MFNKITKGTVDATISTKDYTVKNGKDLLGKEQSKELKRI